MRHMELGTEMPPPAAADRRGPHRPPRLTRVILAPEPWGGFQQPVLQRWAMDRARRDLVVYLGPQLGMPRAHPSSGMGGGSLPWADVDTMVQQWINLTGHFVRGVYVLQRLDYLQLADPSGPPHAAPGLMEQWLAWVASSPLEVVRGFADAQWLGPPPAHIVDWAADTPDVGRDTIPAPWPAALEYPLAIVAGARPEHGQWLQQVAERAPAWRWLVPQVLMPADAARAWPSTATPVPWPLAADALAAARAASAIVVPPAARPAGLGPWHSLSEARRLPWIGPGPGESGLAKWLSADTPLACARALGLLTWPEPRGMRGVSA